MLVLGALWRSYPGVLPLLYRERLAEHAYEFFHGAFAVGILEDVYASGHFVVGDIERYGFDSGLIVDGGLGEDCDKLCLADELQEDIDFIELYSYPEVVVGTAQGLEGVSSLQSLGG